MWYIYILQCADESLYTGITNNLPKRMRLHKEGKGAAYTKSHPVVSCVYEETCTTRSDALKRECNIKKMTRKEKLDMIHRQ